MFSLTTRFQAVSNQALSALIGISVLVIVTSLLQLLASNAWSLNSTSITNVRPTVLVRSSFNYGSVNRKPKENSKIQFDMDADLTPLFNWNTKQVFVYLTAEYPGKKDGSSNKVTYWDKIITSKEQAKIHLRDQKAKYSVWDVEKSFRERDAVLRLEWNIQPHIGPLVFGETGAGTDFQFAKYEEKKPKKEKKEN